MWILLNYYKIQLELSKSAVLTSLSSLTLAHSLCPHPHSSHPFMCTCPHLLAFIGSFWLIYSLLWWSSAYISRLGLNFSFSSLFLPSDLSPQRSLLRTLQYELIIPYNAMHSLKTKDKSCSSFNFYNLTHVLYEQKTIK